MPIYIEIRGITGNITSSGHEKPIESGACGGIWKTTNFLTTDNSGPIAVSRISLASGGGVDAQEALPTRKAAELFERAGRSAPSGKLCVATNVGVFSKEPIAGKTRLIFGDDQGVFSKPGVGVLKSTDGGRTWPASGRASGPRVYKTTDGGQTWVSKKVPVVELTVTDRGNIDGRKFRLKGVTIAPGVNGILELSYSSVEF